MTIFPHSSLRTRRRFIVRDVLHATVLGHHSQEQTSQDTSAIDGQSSSASLPVDDRSDPGQSAYPVAEGDAGSDLTNRKSLSAGYGTGVESDQNPGAPAPLSSDQSSAVLEEQHGALVKLKLSTRQIPKSHHIPRRFYS